MNIQVQALDNAKKVFKEFASTKEASEYFKVDEVFIEFLCSNIGYVIEDYTLIYKFS